MGMYSLENYERYKTKKIRPKQLAEVPFNKGNGQMNYITFSWSELEPERGEYRIELMEDAIKHTINPVIRLTPIIPSWVKTYEKECFAALIRKIGSYLDSNEQLIGIVISTLGNSKEEWNAYIDSFDKLTIFAAISNSKLIEYLKGKGRSYGLLVECSEETYVDCCEKIARLNIQDIWKRSPVLLHITDKTCGPNIKREAYRWHASMSNLNFELGYHLALRRATYPEVVSSNGYLPLRLWFVNSGSSKIYETFHLKLLLRQDNLCHELQLYKETASWMLGDITHNEIIHLPKMNPGNYVVSIGLFFQNGTPINLNMQGKEEEGFYQIGTIEVDMITRDNLLNIWDTYYPEGYYPLEDPKVPEEV